MYISFWFYSGTSDPKDFERKREPKDFYLIVTALVPYKRVDLAIEAFNKNGKPLNFYYRNGFKKLCSVKEYITNNSLSVGDDLEDEFEDMDDHIIVKNI